MEVFLDVILLIMELLLPLQTDVKYRFMVARRLTTIFSDQKEELLSHDLSLLCSRMEEGQFSSSSNLVQIVIGVRRSGKSTL